MAVGFDNNDSNLGTQSTNEKTSKTDKHSSPATKPKNCEFDLPDLRPFAGAVDHANLADPKDLAHFPFLHHTEDVNVLDVPTVEVPCDHYIDLPDLPPPYTLLTDQQKQALEQFKERIKEHINPVRHYDEYFSRYLWAAGYNIDKAVQMFHRAVELRQIYDCDNILETFPKSKYFHILRKYWPAKLLGLTKDKSYVFLERIGQVDLPSLFKQVPFDELMKLHMWTLECQEKLQQVRKQGWSSGYVIIQDCLGLGLSHKAGLDFVRRSAEIDQDCYPGMIRRTYFINTPGIFSVIFALIKPIIEERTIKKLEILGDAYKEPLLKLIDEDTLPPFLHGKNTIQLPPGGVLKTDVDNHGTKVIIKNGDKYKATREVKKGDHLELQFMTEDNNITFAVLALAHPSDKSPKHVMAPKVYDSHELCIWMDIQVQEDGIFVFEWDNSSSWLRNKVLTYLVRPKGAIAAI